MSNWKNPHLVTALLVAPVLAVFAYMAIDALVRERPAPAVAGAVYPLVARPNCRRPGGQCTLVNASVELHLAATSESLARARIRITASHPLQRVALAITDSTLASPELTPFAAVDRDRHVWQGELQRTATGASAVRLAAVSNDSRFFAEFSSDFLAGDGQ